MPRLTQPFGRRAANGRAYPALDDQLADGLHTEVAHLGAISALER